MVLFIKMKLVENRYRDNCQNIDYISVEEFLIIYLKMSVDIKDLSPVTLVKKIYPTVAELTKIVNKISCPEGGCKQEFTSQSNLTMHIEKHHKHKALTKSDGCIQYFHCPAVSCLYNQTMHFVKLKYLKQHYLKVHADKIFRCEKCERGFATEWMKNNHTEMCGKRFECKKCPANYGSKEALLTHIRRKNHQDTEVKSVEKLIPQLVSFRDNSEKTRLILPKPSSEKNSKQQPERNNKKQFILSKLNSSQQNIAVQTINILPIIIQINDNKTSLIRVNKEVQTDSINFKKSRNTIKRKSTQHTQTCNKKKLGKSAETQTIGDCILKRPIQDVEKKFKIKKNAIETQTKSIIANNFQIKDETSSTQTSLSLTNINSEINLNYLNMMHSSSQTNFNNLNIFEDTSFGNCNTETQTDLIFNHEFFQTNIETQTNEDISLDLYSNMYTQTCDDLLSEMEFTDIQTQTNWPDYDMFVSTETQTLLSNCTKNVLQLDNIALNNRGISHMETQTDTEFQQMLEEINA